MGVGRWIIRGAVAAIVIYAGLVGYEAHKYGDFSLPDLPDGAFTLSFKSGFRAIVIDAEVDDYVAKDSSKHFRRLGYANSRRKYLGYPVDVPSWFKHAWSWCRPPTQEETAQRENWPEDLKKLFATARFDAVCTIEADGKTIPRGLIFSVPRL